MLIKLQRRYWCWCCSQLLQPTLCTDTPLLHNLPFQNIHPAALTLCMSNTHTSALCCWLTPKSAIADKCCRVAQQLLRHGRRCCHTQKNWANPAVARCMLRRDRINHNNRSSTAALLQRHDSAQDNSNNRERNTVAASCCTAPSRCWWGCGIGWLSLVSCLNGCVGCRQLLFLWGSW